MGRYPAPMQDFADRHVIVTGGTGALGAAVIGQLLERGATCHVPVFAPEEHKRFPYTDHERVVLHDDIDLRHGPSVKALFKSVEELWGSIHLAGGFAMGPITDAGIEGFRHLLEMNAVTCFASCAAAVRRIRATGQGGRIVNVAAKPALVPTGLMVAYAASKAAVASITQSLAEEVADDSIWVNAVVPSIMDTRANRAAMPDADHSAWPKLEEVAATVVFLASPENKVTRGALVPVYGRS